MREIHREKVSDKKHIEKSKISYNDSARIRNRTLHIDSCDRKASIIKLQKTRTDLVKKTSCAICI